MEYSPGLENSKMVEKRIIHRRTCSNKRKEMNMNKKNLSQCFLIILFIFASLVNAQTTFQRTYGGAYYDSGFRVLETSDHGYIIVGTTRSFSNDTTDIYVIRTDEIGDTLWTKTYGGDLWDSGVAIQHASDGGYIIAAASNSINPGSYDIYLIKINTSGDTLWTKSVGGPATDYTHSLQTTSDGGYVVLAHTLSFGHGLMDFYLLKFDQKGDTLWTKTYGGAQNDWGATVQQTRDGGFILVGDTQSFGDSNGDVYLIKTDTNGDTLWTKTYGGGDYDRGYHVIQTNDNGYIIAGVTKSFGAGEHDLYIIKTDASGDTLWTKTLGGPDWDAANFVQQTADGDYILVGGINTIGLGASDVYLVKMNSAGDTLWTRFFGGVKNETASCVRQTTDGGFVIVGRSESFTTGQGYDVYLIKTNESGNITAVKDLDREVHPKDFTLAQNYPNPFNPKTIISYQLPVERYVVLNIYNTAGQIVATLVSERQQAGNYKYEWDASRFPSGVYVYRMQAGTFHASRKLLLLR